MLIRTEMLNAKRLRRALLAIGTASAALCIADPAMAACVIAPGGTGTVANLGPNSTVVCTGTTNGITVAGTNADMTVHVEGGAQINGVVGDEIFLNGNAAHVLLGGGTTPGPAIVRDVSISAFGNSAQIDIVDGSVIDQSGNSTALIMVNGNGAGIGIGAGSQVTVSRAVQVHGSGATIFLEAGAILSASSGFAASALIFGGLGTQIFNLEGRIETLGANPVEVIVDATDGDDIIRLTNTTRFTTGAFATLTPTFLLDGGNDYDRLYLDNIHSTLRFDSREIEALIVDPGVGGGVSRIYGTHEFQEVRVVNGQLDVFGAAAFGATGSIVDIQGNSRIRLFDTGSGLLTQHFTGSGVLEYHGGLHEFASANSLSGQFLLVGGTPVISHSNAFGTATVGNFANVILRNVNITNTLNGNGNYIIDGSSTHLGGTNGVNGTITVRSGDLVVNNVAALGNGQVLTPAAITIDVGARLVLDISGNGTLNNALSGSGTLEKQLIGNLTINRTNTNFTGQVNLIGGRTFVNADHALGTGVIFLNAALNPGDVIIANALSGSGPIEKNGAGVTQLLGNNSNYSGLILINAGTLRVANGSGLGSANLALSSAGTLQVDIASGSTNVANILQGGGVFRKSGLGQVNLTGPNLHTGGTMIDAGVLRVTGSGPLGTGAVSIASGATLLFDNSVNATLANVLSGAGTFRKAGLGQADLTATNTHGGGTIIDAGTLRVSGSAPLGTGAISVASGATFLFDNSANATLSNMMSGAGIFRKAGSGQLSFTNAFSIGALAVDAGRVRVNSTVTTNAVVATGAILDGTGRIIGNVTNNGTVAPGNSIGTLTVQGNYVHNANATLDIEFDGSGGIDLLAVTGTATLNGGTLRFISLGGAEGTGGTFLTAAGGVTGTFANVVTVGAQLPLAVIYQTNSAIMAPSVLTARPSTFNAQFLAAAETAFAFTDSVAAASNSRGRALWLQGFGSTGSRSASGTTLGYGHDSYGISGGVTLRVGEDTVVGAAIGWSTGDLQLASNGGGGKQDALLGSLYGSHHGDGFTLSAGLFAGKLKQETLRNVSFNGFAASVDGDTDSKLYGGHIGMSADIAKTGDWTFLAKARASYVHQSQDAYTESGTSPLRLTLPKLSANTIEAQAGLGATYDFGSEHSPSELRFDLGARLLSATGSREIPVAFAASNAGVTLQGDKRDGVHGYANSELRHSLGETVTLTLGYAGQVGTANRHEGRVGIRFGF